jgi:hypothetical protein
MARSLIQQRSHSFFGEKMTVRQAHARFAPAGLKLAAVWWRLQAGWTPEAAVSTPNIGHGGDRHSARRITGRPAMEAARA